VAGSADTPGGSSHAFLYSDGAMMDLGTLGGTNSDGYGINNAGQVTGGSSHAFLYSDGQMMDLGTLGGGYPYNSSVGRGINNATPVQVVGAASTSTGATHAFLYSDGQMTDLGIMPRSGLCRADSRVGLIETESARAIRHNQRDSRKVSSSSAGWKRPGLDCGALTRASAFSLSRRSACTYICVVSTDS